MTISGGPEVVLSQSYSQAAAPCQTKLLPCGGVDGEATKNNTVFLAVGRFRLI